MADSAAIGRQLRVLRAAAGRTVASVAGEAGLSVPYIANLENGRGNPTIAALDRLATALGVSLQLTFAPPGGMPSEADSMPASLVRLGRSVRFQRDITDLAESLGAEPGPLSVQLICAFAGLASVLGADPGEAGWGRLLDALLLVVRHPIPPD
jgi:transcriptional regulator with XRE-family HTH domain